MSRIIILAYNKDKNTSKYIIVVFLLMLTKLSDKIIQSKVKSMLICKYYNLKLFELYH